MANIVSQLFHLLLLLGVVCAPLPLVWHVLATHYLSSSTTPALDHMGLAALALWAIVESLVVTGLGLVGHLRLFELVLVEASLLMSGVWLVMRDRPKAASRLRYDIGLPAVREWPAVDRWLLALIGGMSVLLLVQEVWVPTQDYDSLSFQLPRVVEWYQRGTLFEPIPQFPAEGPINRYPYAWNTLYLLALAPMGHDQFILVPNLIAWMMLGLATHGLVRLSGGHPGGSFFAAVLVLLMPLSVVNVHTAHNDLPLAALFLTSIYFSFHAWQQGDGCSALLAGACAGMMLGTKMSGLGYGALLATLWLWVFLRSWLKQRRPQAAIMGALRDHRLMAVLAFASVGVLGSSWYLRNALETGNPLGFVQVSILGRVVWDGTTTKALINRTSLLHNFHLDYLGHWSILGQALRESLGLPGMAFIAAALCAPYTLLRSRAGRAVLLAMIGLCLGSLYIYAAGPYSGKMRPDDDIGSVWIGRQMRYGFPFWGLLAAIAGAQIRTPLSPLVRWILGGVATVATVDALRHSGMFLEWYPRRSPALLVCAIGLCFAASTPALRRITSLGSIRLAAWWRRRPGAIIGAGIVMALLVMLLTSHTTLSALRVRQDVRNSLNGGISRFIDEDLPANERIGFWATHKGYLLYGQALRRPLHSLALHAPSTWEEMLAYVRTEPVDVIAVGPLFEQSRLHGWLSLVANHKSGLQRIHGDDVRNDVLVYRVLPATP
ncbi:MAG: ArnT family glycosyltransferase [Candidatus Rokuibacteriota bacterium]